MSNPRCTCDTDLSNVLKYLMATGKGRSDYFVERECIVRNRAHGACDQLEEPGSRMFVTIINGDAVIRPWSLLGSGGNRLPG